VTAWFFTHQHYDHTGAFCKLSAIDPELKVENIYYNFPSLDELYSYGSRSALGDRIKAETVSLIEHRYNNVSQVVNEKQKIVVDDVVITILRVYNPDIKCNFENNSSLVFRVDGKKSNVLILGDLGVEGGDDVLSKCTYDDLKTNYVQLAHHGMWASVDRLYDIVDADVLIWPSNSTAAKEWINDGAVRAALKPAIDVYLPGSKTITINFPYVFQNNKDKFIENHS
jgi:glyoxylase-like metal-dependent hydrolase (beta-lactamase superfamily II)